MHLIFIPLKCLAKVFFVGNPNWPVGSSGWPQWGRAGHWGCLAGIGYHVPPGPTVGSGLPPPYTHTQTHTVSLERHMHRLLSNSGLYGGVTLETSASMRLNQCLKEKQGSEGGCCHGIGSLTLQLCTSCCWAAGFLLEEAACWAAAMVWVAAAAACLAAFWQKQKMVIYVKYKSRASGNSTCANWMHAWS